MPNSSFFDPIQGSPTYKADPRVRAGYRNVYGTDVSVGVSPVTKEATLDLRFPVGDHQRQQFFTGGAYVRPAGEGAPADYGFKVGFSKKIQPQGLTGGELINRVLGRSVNPEGSSPVINADVRSQLMQSFTPEQLQMLGKEAKQINREYIDTQLGIVPGAEKFGFDVGVDVKDKPQFNNNFSVMPGQPGQVPDTIPGLGPDNPKAAEFARQYAGKLEYRQKRQ
jgi:hypothetical protein